MKTNVVRILDNLGVSYHLLPYDVDPEDLAAERTALKVGLPPEQVFKTLGSCVKIKPQWDALTYQPPKSPILGDFRAFQSPPEWGTLGAVRGGI